MRNWKGDMNPMSLTSSNTSWKSSDAVSDQFPAGLRVLVVDDDPTCLMILEHMLKSCHYEATKCSRAEDALKILRDNKDGYDVVISDVHMPDMDGFRLLEHIGLEMDLPVIMMSADDSKVVVMKGVTHGACDYLIKPVRMEALRNIWQHVVRKKKHEYKDKDFEQSGSVEDVERQQKPSEDFDYSSSANEGNWKNSKKRKDEEDDAEERDDQSTMKKARVVWSVDLHQQFVSAVNQLGIEKAVPKKILELMNVPGITRENVASHLQKYRLYLRRLSGQHQNGLGNSFMGPQDSPYGPMTSYNGLDFQALASSSQLPPQSLATIQAAALSRAANKPLVDQTNLFGYDNSKIRFIEGQQQHNNGKQMNLLHGIPTTMDSKHLAALHQSPQPFGNLNMNSHHSQMVQPRSRTQLLNEIGAGLPLNLQSSVGLPVLPPSAIMGQYGINNNRAPLYSSLSQPSVVDFARSQRGNAFPLGGNSGISTFDSKGVVQGELNNSEMKGQGGFVPNFDVFSELNQSRTDDWGLQGVGSSFQASNVDVAPSVLVQPGFSTDERNRRIRASSVSSSVVDSSLRINPERVPETGFSNGPLHNQYDPEDGDLMSILLKPNQESAEGESELGFVG
ncbi:hypothetical protein ACS0TY_022553 [Phlomoides rotata]